MHPWLDVLLLNQYNIFARAAQNWDGRLTLHSTLTQPLLGRCARWLATHLSPRALTSFASLNPSIYCLTLRPIFTFKKISLWGSSSRAARFARGAAASRQRARQRLAINLRFTDSSIKCSPNQVLTHAARAAAKQLNKLLCRRLNKLPFQAPLVAARRARRALVRVNQVRAQRAPHGYAGL